MLVFACPSCSAKLQMADDLAGTKVRCASCQGVITAPERGETTDAIMAAAGSAAVATPTPTPFAVMPVDNVPVSARTAERPKERERRDDRDDRGPRRDGSSAAAVGAGIGAGAIVAIVLGVGLCVVVPCGIALLVPAVQKTREAAARAQTVNNMKQVVLAIHSHHDTFRTLPPPKHMMPPQGVQPVDLSWRVSILPFIEQQNVFQMFDQTVGWDNPRNQPWSNQVMVVYYHVGRPDASTGTATAFQYFTGPNTIWPDNKKRTFVDIPDGTSNTFLVGEAADPVPWSKPADMAIQPDQPIPLAQGQFIVGMADGTVRVVHRSNAPDAALRMYIDPRDGGLPPPID